MALKIQCFECLTNQSSIKMNLLKKVFVYVKYCSLSFLFILILCIMQCKRLLNKIEDLRHSMHVLDTQNDFKKLFDLCYLKLNKLKNQQRKSI